MRKEHTSVECSIVSWDGEPNLSRQALLYPLIFSIASDRDYFVLSAGTLA